MKKLCLIILQLIFILNVSAQNMLTSKWDKRFGGINNDFIEDIKCTLDSGFVLAGHSKSSSSGNKTNNTNGGYDYWIVKIDVDGNKKWDKNFGGFGNDFLSCIVLTNDGGFILGGFSGSGAGGDKTELSRGGYDYWTIKLDSLGNKQWDRRFGGANDDILFSIVRTADGGFVLNGFSDSRLGGDRTEDNWDTIQATGDYWIVKIDSLGNKQWDRRFGGTDNDLSQAIALTSDKGFLCGGLSSSGINGDKTQADLSSENFWIVRMDSIGNKLWDKVYGGNGGEELISILNTRDNGFVLGGKSYSGISGDKSQPFPGYWIIKIDSIGNKIWDRSFGVGNFFEGPDYSSISESDDHGYLLTGSSTFGSQGDKSEANLGSRQTWIIKTDSLGRKMWDKTIFSNGYDEGKNTIQTLDGCYIIAVQTDAGVGGYKTQPNWEPHDSLYDYWVVKFCDSTLTTLSETVGDVHFSIYPNPTSGGISITLENENLKDAIFTLTNISGQLIYQNCEKNLANTYTKMLDIQALPNGVYLLNVIVGEQRIARKVIKQ